MPPRKLCRCYGHYRVHESLLEQGDQSAATAEEAGGFKSQQTTYRELSNSARHGVHQCRAARQNPERGDSPPCHKSRTKKNLSPKIEQITDCNDDNATQR